MALAIDRAVMPDNGLRNILRQVPPDSVLYLPGLDYGNWYTNKIKDYSGQGNDGTIGGATTKVLPSDLAYLDFDALDDVVTITDAVSIQDIFASGGTVQAWIKPDTGGEGGLGRIAAKGYANAATKGWLFYLREEVAGFCKIGFLATFDGATNGVWKTTLAVVPVGTWSLVGVGYNHSDVANDPIFYFNNTVPAVTEVSTPVGAYVSDATRNGLIGNDDDGANTFDGGIGLDKWIKGTILTEAQSANDYAQTRKFFGV